ncbi:MAG: cell division protein FtsQ/DivIB [Sphaerotilus sp.]|nr:cell division protein FtsQ/DivIB [Sphaerotilus sp.]
MRTQSATSATRSAGSTATAMPIDVRLMRSGANVLLVLVLLAGLAVLVTRVARSPWFNLREIHVEGEVAHNTAETVRRHVTPLLQGSYLTMNLGQARTAFESVPWVRRAEVRRIWPHDLVVRIEEHHPMAYWAREDTDHLLVNTHGELFEVNLGDVEEDNLPTLAGPTGTSLQVMTMWQALAPVLAPLRQRIDRVVLTDRGSWRVHLERGTLLELGRGESDQIVARTQRFVRSVEQVSARFEHRAIEYADLRHSESYALRLAGMGTMPVATRTGKGH